MKYYVFILILFSIDIKAQSDTSYIYFKEASSNNSIHRSFRHEKDTGSFYPFDGGRIYVYHKKSGEDTKDLRFSFLSYTLDWMDQQFEYIKVDTDSILKEENFICNEWFEKTIYAEILKQFNQKGKVIYLLDEKYIENGQGYLVRVYFNYSAEE